DESCLTVLSNPDIRSDERSKIIAEAPDKIKEALKFIRNQLFEVPFIAFYRKEYVESCLVINDLWKVPFIAFYRKEYVESCLVINDLWKVYQWDEKVCSFLVSFKILIVHGVQTVEGLMDVSTKFQLYYGSEVPKMIDWEKIQNLSEDDPEREAAEMRFRAATRTDKYMLCIQNGLGGLAARFGLTPLQFAENLDWKRHEIEQDDEEPLKAAEQFVKCYEGDIECA
ncbi:unnamed protein product, partial [Gongylonema pulchrum]|uniref:Peptidase_M13_N domain-containing protein n=1 Tax=Gongylonema pulchrum TaxID=637853 RepID=A0A183ESP9_9BILA